MQFVTWFSGPFSRIYRIFSASVGAPGALRHATDAEAPIYALVCAAVVFAFCPQTWKYYFSTVNKKLGQLSGGLCRAWTGRASRDSQTAGSAFFCRQSFLLQGTLHGIRYIMQYGVMGRDRTLLRSTCVQVCI